MHYNTIIEMEQGIKGFEDKKNIKILIQPQEGLADCFGALAFVLGLAKKYEFSPKQIYFTNRRFYSDLDNFLIFKEILWVKYDKKPEDCTHVFNAGAPNFLNDYNWATDYHISNFVKFNSEIQKNSEKYHSPIGLHFRAKKEEFGRPTEMHYDHNYFIKKFFKIYNPEEKYFIATDSSFLNYLIDEHSNIKMYIKKNLTSNFLGRQNSYDAILDLCVLSKCNLIYESGMSGFTRLAVALSENLQKIPFDIIKKDYLKNIVNI